jgi:RNA-directed DNA polymerase
VIDLDVQKFFDEGRGTSLSRRLSGHRRPLGAAVFEAVARCAAAVPGRHSCRAGQGNSAGVGGLADPGQPVHALRVRRLDGPELPELPFERYADDGVVHCTSRRQAEDVLAEIAARMSEVGLRLHPDKTRIVYCKDGRRRAEHEHTSFTFLGYAFRARGARSKYGRCFTGFLPAISPEALKARSARLRELRIHRRTDLSLDGLARWLNPIIAGWMRYYGRFYRTALDPLLKRVNTYLRRWAGRKYKRLRTHQRFSRWWAGLLQRQPGLFAHWSAVRSYG